MITLPSEQLRAGRKLVSVQFSCTFYGWGIPKDKQGRAHLRHGAPPASRRSTPCWPPACLQGQGQSCAMNPRSPQSTPEREGGGLELTLLGHSWKGQAARSTAELLSHVGL